MKKLSKSNSGFSAIEVVLVLLIVSLLVFVGCYAWQAKNNVDNTYSNASNASIPAITTSKPASDLVIKEWNVKMPLTKDVSDAYYAYDSKEQTVSISTHQLDVLVKSGKAGCIGGLDPLQKVKADDPQLQTLVDNKYVGISVKAGDYYILTKPEPHPLCAVVLNSTTDEINSLVNSLTTQIKLLQPN